nr:Copper efflux oxidase [Candidatus Pantoea persica]
MTTPMFNVTPGQLEKWTISGEGDKMLHPLAGAAKCWCALTTAPPPNTPIWRTAICWSMKTPA